MNTISTHIYIRNLEGKEFPSQVTTTVNEELNGKQTLTFTVEPLKLNEAFIHDIAEMWEVIDHSGVEYKIIYAKKRGKGNKSTVDIKAKPLFFDKFDTDRIYETYDSHMTPRECFNIIFADSGFDFILNGSFAAVEWQGFGKGDTRLTMFKKAIERYKAEFKIVGNTIYLENLIGRDTSIMYRYKLNASNVVQENDAVNFWTYAKGFGDFAEGEESNAKLKTDYTSPLANIPGIGLRHAPPTYDGRVTNEITMKAGLKELVDSSLKISVSTDIHDLRKQGYALGQPEKGDRIFLIDERIGLNDEVRVIDTKTKKDWEGEVIDLKLIIGSESLVKRHQSDLKTAVGRINDLFEGKEKITMTMLDSAIAIATAALQSAQTQLEFTDNGIYAIDKNNPNLITIFNSAGIGISEDGGNTFRTAMTGHGIVADVITAGVLRGIDIVQDDGKGGVIELSGGVLTTYSSTDTRIMQVDQFGLAMFDSGDGKEAGSLRDSSIESGSIRGFSLNSAKEYISIGFGEAAGTARPILHSRGDLGETALYGNNGNGVNSGKLRLRAVGDSSAHGKDVPSITLTNTGGSTDWGSVIVSTGRGADNPGASGNRYGFEVWQFNGGNFAGNKQMLRVDTNASGKTFISMYVQQGTLPSEIWPYSSTSLNLHSDMIVDGYVNAADFQPGSLAELKDNIGPMSKSALSILLEAEIHEYNLKTDLEKDIHNKKYGFVIGEGYNTPTEVLSDSKKAISLYSHSSLNTKAIQELSAENKELRETVTDLIKRIETLENAK